MSFYGCPVSAHIFLCQSLKEQSKNELRCCILFLVTHELHRCKGARMKFFYHALLCTLLCAGNFFSASQSVADRLNVVLIVADDLGWGELGCYGQQKIPTPNIDQLAASGQRFTQFYAGAPVCAPSRCVLMTGLHLGHAEIRGNLQAKKAFPEFDEGQYPIRPETITFPKLLQQSGYRTGAMGKWGLGPVGSTGDPNNQGFDLFFGYNCQAVAHSFYPESLWRNAEKVHINDNPVPGHKKQPEGEVRMEDWIAETYASRPIVAEAEQFIHDHKKDNFFLYCPFTEPHVAMHPPIETVNRFPNSWDHAPYRGGNAYLPHPRPRAGYAAMIAELDDHVGRVVSAVEKAGLMDQTVIIFTSDNGTTHEGRGEPELHIGGVDALFFNSTLNLRGYKGSVYEGGLRVPCIVRLPGERGAGRVIDTPAWFPDIFPTICDITGIKKPQNLDGISLWKFLEQEASLSPRPSPFLWVFPEYGGQMAVRMDNMKAVRRNLKASKAKWIPWEVYDLVNDPAETIDLAEQRPDIIAAAVKVLRQQITPNSVFPMPGPEI